MKLCSLTSVHIYCVPGLVEPLSVINSFPVLQKLSYCLNKSSEALPFFWWSKLTFLSHTPTQLPTPFSYILLNGDTSSFSSLFNLGGLIIPLKANPSSWATQYASYLLGAPCFISCLLCLESWPILFFVVVVVLNYILLFLNKTFRSTYLLYVKHKTLLSFT